MSCSLQVAAVVILWQQCEAHHGNGLGLDHDLRRDGGEVGQVGQNIHHRHYRHGYDDGQGQVPAGGEVMGHLREEHPTYFLIISDFFPLYL